MRGATKPLTLCLVAGVTATLLSASAGAADQGRYWRDAQGNIWRSGSGECVRTRSWTPQGDTPDCDAEPARAEAAAPGTRAAAGDDATLPVQMAALEAPKPVVAPKPVELNTVTLFDVDSATVRPDAVEAIEQIAARAKAASEVELVTVAGYTDNTGPEAYNLALSERRAKAVKDQLVRAGIDPRAIKADGFGESHPVASNTTAEGRQQNRRVVIDVRAKILAQQ